MDTEGIIMMKADDAAEAAKLVARLDHVRKVRHMLQHIEETANLPEGAMGRIPISVAPFDSDKSVMKEGGHRCYDPLFLRAGSPGFAHIIEGAYEALDAERAKIVNRLAEIGVEVAAPDENDDADAA